MWPRQQSIILSGSEAHHEHVNRTGKMRMPRPPRLLLPNERYRMGVFVRAMALVTSTERLETCRTFVQRFPSPRTYVKNGIGHHTWLQYHFGYYVILLVGLPDVALILTNAVFSLGNADRNCKPDIIKNNAYVRGTRAKTGLDALEHLVTSYRTLRNIHVHRGRPPDIPEIMDSDDLDYFMVMSDVSLTSKPLVPPEVLDCMFKGPTTEIVKRMAHELDELQHVLSRFFDSLLPTYRAHVKARDGI